METNEIDNVMKDILDCSLLAHNTFGIDARCRRFLEFETVDEARQVAGILAQSDVPFIIVGEGSNLLLTRDYEGIVFTRLYATRLWLWLTLALNRPTMCL